MIETPRVFGVRMGQRVRVQIGVIAAEGAIDGSVFGTVIGFGEPIISEFDGETEESATYIVQADNGGLMIVEDWRIESEERNG